NRTLQGTQSKDTTVSENIQLNFYSRVIAHDGIFDFVSMYGSTEETFFVNWDLGGPYWNPEPKNSYSASPHNFVKNWNTPIMIVQGGMDFRVSETQAFEAFTAAKMMGVDAKLLYFPQENHWVLKPQNGILWQREFYKWLDLYLK
ncbi:MAG: prolyl oligopeptidase family serine peptidase, partial [Bacteroidales bacterium]|nr:prolyl oligopeptidase family serine peptidase [Bacteroidales bacterium]